MPFLLTSSDITKLAVDAIVNAANVDLQRGGGVCGAIFDAAGAEALQDACDALAPISTGEAVLTDGFRLPARYVIHAAGPRYHARTQALNREQLHQTYVSALTLAVEHHCRSIAFPLISSGIYGYPREEAFEVASSAIQSFLHALPEDQDLDVYLSIFVGDSTRLARGSYPEIASFIADYAPYKRSRSSGLRPSLQSTSVIMREEAPRYQPLPLEDVLEPLDEPFSTTLLRWIDAKGMTDVEVYKRANLDRRLFSKIRSNRSYTPTKRTILALAIALQLNLEECHQLLEVAGFTLSRSVLFDVIVEYFITHEVFDIYEINEVLFAYDQPLLGAVK